ncbi:hypothetical protein QYE76_020200 [Lolium multiflorum]|uniref:protein-serine/threonine phosphatase n=1 Tax=Lolium multiflorum TaxID=4521 RepID=A0AAD8R8E5_LOLMU|nr:hypothetical protein QYE76_020200 [Lolium multiflorum]
MASANVNNINMSAAPAAGAEGADHAAECRPTRRRRLAPVEDVANTSAGTEVKPPSSDADASTEGEEGSAAVINVAAALLPGDSSSGPVGAAAWPVRFGSVAVIGRLRKMEDTVSLRPSFCVWAGGEPMHFFGVFDGHGGPHVAALCKEQMHAILAEELAIAAEDYLAHRGEEGAEERAWRTALSRSFARVDALAPAACACGRVATAAEGACACPLSAGERCIIPDRPDEMARIEAAGGRVMFIDGPRVRGVLAMSRALGHELLKPEVICEPEITITIRSDDDHCLILASDGLWDAISNKKACDIARQCKENGNLTRARAAGSDEACRSSGGGAPGGHHAATVLARFALCKGSCDNISVVVIDLNVMG